MFDAFFYIQPKLSFENTFNPCSSWTYPEDVSNITNEFRDIPNFCFPDIDVLKIERADFSFYQRGREADSTCDDEPGIVFVSSVGMHSSQHFAQFLPRLLHYYILMMAFCERNVSW
eukprot:gene42594-56616_t